MQSKKIHAKSFRDLEAYQKAQALAQDIYNLTKAFPKEETYSLTDQLRRSSRSVGAQIAEAWGKRRYERHFISKLTDADAEQMETQHWLSVAASCQYLSNDQTEELISELSRVGRMLNAMMRKAYLFCGKSGKTDQGEEEVTDERLPITGH